MLTENKHRRYRRLERELWTLGLAPRSLFTASTSLNFAFILKKSFLAFNGRSAPAGWSLFNEKKQRVRDDLLNLPKKQGVGREWKRREEARQTKQMLIKE